MSPERERKYECGKCPSKFFRKSHKEYHEKTVHESKQFKCETCNKEFTQKHTVKKHIDSVHLHKKYICKDCSYECRGEHLLKYHVKVIHLGAQINFCDMCSKSHRNDLKAHNEAVHLNITTNAAKDLHSYLT